MNYLKNLALALLFGAILSVSAFADGKPNQGGPGKDDHAKGSHFDLSDSCWKVFVSGLSAADASKLASDQATISANQTQIEALYKQLGDLFKNGAGKKDTAVWAKIKVLQSQIDDLNKANGAAQADIYSIIKNNNTLFETVAKNCHKEHPIDPRDTGKGGPRDTSKGKGGSGNDGHDKDARKHFGLSDSCWKIFLSQITTADADQLAADQKIITDNKTQIDAIIKQIRALKGKRDSSVRAQIKSLLAQIQTLLKSSGTAAKDYASVLKKYESILQSIRKDCGRTHRKGTTGDPNNGLSVTDIVPNPASLGSSPSITITLRADAQVSVSIGSATAKGAPIKQIFNGTLTAGSHTQALDVSGMGAGMYLVYIQSGSEVVTKKLVIQ